MHLKNFIAITFIPMLVTIVAILFLLFNSFSKITAATDAYSNHELPTVLNNYKASMGIENIKRNVAMVYASVGNMERRKALIVAQAIAAEEAFKNSPKLQEKINIAIGYLHRMYELKNKHIQQSNVTDTNLQEIIDLRNSTIFNDKIPQKLKDLIKEISAVGLQYNILKTHTKESFAEFEATLKPLLASMYKVNIYEEVAPVELISKMYYLINELLDIKNKSINDNEQIKIEFAKINKLLNEILLDLNADSTKNAYHSIKNVEATVEFTKHYLAALIAALLIVLVTIYYVINKYLRNPIKIISADLENIKAAKPISGSTNIKITELKTISDLITEFNTQLSSIYALSRNLEQEKELLTNMVIKDGLTGIYNRRYFDIEYKKLLEEISINPRHYTMMMIDIDLFKVYNDTMGHSAGDDCITKVAQAIQSSLYRSTDKVFRYGGEEFAVILPGVSKETSVRLADRIRTHILDLQLPHPHSTVEKIVTISIGVASLKPNDLVEEKDFLNLADDALYKAKQNGRNQAYLNTIENLNK